MGQMLEVDLDVFTPADASDRWYEADCRIRADHPATPVNEKLAAFGRQDLKGIGCEPTSRLTGRKGR
jgi:hypothetical protein